MRSQAEHGTEGKVSHSLLFVAPITENTGSAMASAEQIPDQPQPPESPSFAQASPTLRD